MGGLIQVGHPINGVVHVRLNRPEKHNALNLEMVDTFLGIIHEAEEKITNRVLLITGAGSSFCAGMDLAAACNIEGKKVLLEKIQTLYTILARTTLVTIAAVHGAALAGGAGVAACCDFILATNDVKFGFPEVQRGIVPAMVATLIVRRIPMQMAKEMLLLGELVGSEKGLAIGLFYQAAALEQLVPAALELARKALRGGPNALRKTKQLLFSMFETSFHADMQKALETHALHQENAEAKEGMKAFLEKRPPSWIKE